MCYFSCFLTGSLVWNEEEIAKQHVEQVSNPRQKIEEPKTPWVKARNASNEPSLMQLNVPKLSFESSSTFCPDESDQSSISSARESDLSDAPDEKHARFLDLRHAHYGKEAKHWKNHEETDEDSE